jgi:hypothetical protein
MGPWNRNDIIVEGSICTIITHLAILISVNLQILQFSVNI